MESRCPALQKGKGRILTWGCCDAYVAYTVRVRTVIADEVYVVEDLGTFVSFATLVQVKASLQAVGRLKMNVHKTAPGQVTEPDSACYIAERT